MLDAGRIEAAAALLWQHWREGRRLPALPPVLRPTTRAEGYAIQSWLETRDRRSLFGWKIAATSAAGQRAHQRRWAAGRADPGRPGAVPDGATVPLGANAMLVAEPEFVFRLAHDLPPRAPPIRAGGGDGGGRRAAPRHRGAGQPLRRFHHRRRAAADRRQCLRATVHARRRGAARLARARPRRGMLSRRRSAAATHARASAPMCWATRASRWPGWRTSCRGHGTTLRPGSTSPPAPAPRRSASGRRR